MSSVNCRLSAPPKTHWPEALDELYNDIQLIRVATGDAVHVIEVIVENAEMRDKLFDLDADLNPYSSDDEKSGLLPSTRIRYVLTNGGG